MVAPNPLAARRRTNSSSLSVTVPSSWEESVVSGAITNRFAISRPQLNRNEDQTTIHKTPNIPQIERQFTSYLPVLVLNLVLRLASSARVALRSVLASLMPPRRARRG